jgi:hypothetical protein
MRIPLRDHQDNRSGSTTFIRLSETWSDPDSIFSWFKRDFGIVALGNIKFSGLAAGMSVWHDLIILWTSPCPPQNEYGKIKPLSWICHLEEDCFGDNPVLHG